MGSAFMAAKGWLVIEGKFSGDSLRGMRIVDFRRNRPLVTGTQIAVPIEVAVESALFSPPPAQVTVTEDERQMVVIGVWDDDSAEADNERNDQ